MSDNEMRTALDHIATGRFRQGDGLDAAHAICQRHEGEAHFDWHHALIHRIEGDQPNADYWYRRSGHARHEGPVEDEWEIIRRAAG